MSKGQSLLKAEMIERIRDQREVKRAIQSDRKKLLDRIAGDRKVMRELKFEEKDIDEKLKKLFEKEDWLLEDEDVAPQEPYLDTPPMNPYTYQLSSPSFLAIISSGFTADRSKGAGYAHRQFFATGEAATHFAKREKTAIFDTMIRAVGEPNPQNKKREKEHSNGVKENTSGNEEPAEENPS